MTTAGSLDRVSLEHQLNRLEAENQRLHILVATLRRDRADHHDFMRQEIGRCSKQ